MSAHAALLEPADHTTDASTAPNTIAVRPCNVTRQEEAEILTLRRDGRTFQEIADLVDRDRSTVTRIVNAYDDEAAETARKLLSGNAIAFVQDWIAASQIAKDKGHHGAARDGLLYSRVLEPLASDAASQVNVQVNIGMPGQPAGYDPVDGKA